MTNSDDLLKSVLSEDLDVHPDDATNLGLSITPPPMLPFEIPDKFVNIQQSVIDNVSRYLTVVIETGTQGREIDVKAILENTKNMFRDGPRYHDSYWIQHCASTIRELIDFLEPDDFRRSFSGIPTKDADPNTESIFTFFEQSLAYLSDIVHFRESLKVGKFDRLYLNQGYGTMTKEDFIKNESVFLEKVCIDIVYTLNQLFNSYRVGHSTTNT